ncbi:hypothetical protein K1T71_009426, partial [Dendrolimus kikuchii]
RLVNQFSRLMDVYDIRYLLYRGLNQTPCLIRRSSICTRPAIHLPLSSTYNPQYS